ncbi:bifunctional acetate--CoA ligase family protein/GNAT family N-acetyltransferase [Halomonas sp. ML-15]|uniref:bifunctional acetate--CoA ligase family protein/GNAT family N-acetyltransferase n=1 Tax=Halomonas sp. ML-15 TaxID=2773305 RepID=UPI001745FF72|nr:bifunctional acetate--CoA ligase family protein/GNAT family N-acetyltransferase [Halomonas sp. ML-15]MBD3894387.1 bifunctional acetate--CoA ligase family protein/GNAT family N-acetyltransferase [Halomonas sp. ML-15]
MGTRFLRHFFEPRSLAIIGASEKPHSMGGLVVRNLLDAGFPGELSVVNPKGYASVYGVPCVKRVGDLPASPDLAVICSPVESVPKLIERLGEIGVKAVMVLSGGAYLDDRGGDGGSIRERMIKAARISGIRVLGPECLGLIVPGRKLNATYASQPVKPGRVAYLGQSGMLGNAMIDWAAGRGIGFSHLVTLGDSVDVMLPDMIDYINQHAPTQAILLHLERIHDAQHFMTALREASRNRLVLAIKSGRTPESDISGLAPTPGIANRDVIFDAALARAGVVRVDDSDELFDALETLSRMKPLRGDRLAIVSNGLGPAMLAIDKLISAGGRLASFSDETRRALTHGAFDMSLPGHNPVDLGGNATPERMVDALEVVAADPDVDAVLVVHAPTRFAPSRVTAEAIVANRKRFKRNLLTSWMGLEEALSARHESNLAGIPTYISPEKAVKAFMHMVDYQRVQALLQQTPPSLPFATTAEIRQRCHALIEQARDDGRETLTHSETAQVLAAYGIPSAPSRYVHDAEGAAAASFDEPMALKVVHDHNLVPYRYRRHPHKLSAGMLQDLVTPEQVAEGVTRLTDKVAEKFPGTTIREFCLQPMQRGKHSMQLCAGITRDPIFGPVIVFGIGGYKVNVLADRHVALPPINMTLADDLIARTHASKLIREHSRDPQRDIERLCQLLVKLSQMASDLPALKGLELNPVLLNRDGVVAVDFAMDLGAPARHAIMPYPEELREWVTLDDSMAVEVRPIRAEDAPLITAFHTQLSEESIRFRYFHHKADLTKRDLSMLAHINYDRQMAFIAEHHCDDGSKEMLGVVRVWNDPDNIRTEFSVIIRDDMHGHGLGSLLMNKMIRYCRGVGTLEMVGTVMVDNHPMRALMKHLGFRLRYDMEEQVMHATLRLNEPESDWQKLRLDSAME